jgi:hypothetical protein
MGLLSILTVILYSDSRIYRKGYYIKKLCLDNI